MMDVVVRWGPSRDSPHHLAPAVLFLDGGGWFAVFYGGWFIPSVGASPVWSFCVCFCCFSFFSVMLLQIQLHPVRLFFFL
jgi:hypothetical protein